MQHGFVRDDCGALGAGDQISQGLASKSSGRPGKKRTRPAPLRSLVRRASGGGYGAGATERSHRRQTALCGEGKGDSLRVGRTTILIGKKPVAGDGHSVIKKYRTGQSEYSVAGFSPPPRLRGRGSAFLTKRSFFGPVSASHLQFCGIDTKDPRFADGCDRDCGLVVLF